MRCRKSWSSAIVAKVQTGSVNGEVELGETAILMETRLTNGSDVLIYL